jgi:hypothetical protein
MPEPEYAPQSSPTPEFVLGPNPFAKSTFYHALWAAAGRLAADEWTQALSVIRKTKQADLTLAFAIESIVCLFDVRANGLILGLVSSGRGYGAASCYAQALQRLREAHVNGAASALRRHAAELALSAAAEQVWLAKQSVVPALTRRLLERENYWVRQAFCLARHALCVNSHRPADASVIQMNEERCPDVAAKRLRPDATISSNGKSKQSPTVAVRWAQDIREAGVWNEAELAHCASRDVLPAAASAEQDHSPVVSSPDMPATVSAVVEGDASGWTPVGSNKSRPVRVKEYKREVKQLAGRKLTNMDIWHSAGYESGTEFYRWQRQDPKTPNHAASQKFERVLKEKPHLPASKA